MLQHQGAVEPSGGVALSADNKAYPVKVSNHFSQVVAHSFPRLEGAAPHPDQCIETL
jgi:hypothetical protein